MTYPTPLLLNDRCFACIRTFPPLPSPAPVWLCFGQSPLLFVWRVNRVFHLLSCLFLWTKVTCDKQSVFPWIYSDAVLFMCIWTPIFWVNFLDFYVHFSLARLNILPLRYILNNAEAWLQLDLAFGFAEKATNCSIFFVNWFSISFASHINFYI